MALPSNVSADKLAACGWDHIGVSYYKQSPAAVDLEKRFLAYLGSLGLSVRVTSRVRTCDQQYDLYMAGRTTAAPTTSQHEFGFAFDLVPTTGWSRYGASFAEAVRWLVNVSIASGYSGLAEADHAHIEIWPSATWRKFLAARDWGVLIPLPSLPSKRS